MDRTAIGLQPIRGAQPGYRFAIRPAYIFLHMPKVFPDFNNIIYNSNSVILSQYRDNIYILDNHSIYKINPLTGPKKILIYEELNYNKENTIYIYNNK